MRRTERRPDFRDRFLETLQDFAEGGLLMENGEINLIRSHQLRAAASRLATIQPKPRTFRMASAPSFFLSE